MTDPIKVELSLTEAEALALAQFVKRAHWDTWRPLAADEAEAHQMKNGIVALQQALAEAGYAPR